MLPVNTLLNVLYSLPFINEILSLLFVFFFLKGNLILRGKGNCDEYF